jgi:hypothetical protein
MLLQNYIYSVHKVTVNLRLWYAAAHCLRSRLSVSKMPLKCDISLYSVVEQRLKCNAGSVCLIQFLLAMVLSIEEHVFLVEHVFWEDNRYTDFVHEQSAEKLPGKKLWFGIRKATKLFFHDSKFWKGGNTSFLDKYSLYILHNEYHVAIMPIKRADCKYHTETNTW